ncbi:MAG: aspartate carbamoyltransferase [Nitrosopumilaceae archaeon]
MNVKKLLTRNEFFDRDIISVSQFEQCDIEFIYTLYVALKECRGKGVRLLKDKVMAALFYEPSTRTSSSFIAAMTLLGGGVIPITQGVQFSSVTKGENLSDTVKSLEQLSDVIVLRHPEVGSAEIAAQISAVPIINAGDGIGEHPTQALLDLFTILERLDTSVAVPKDLLTVAMIGDLRYGRTVHSLVQLLPKVFRHIKFTFVSPKVLKMPDNILAEVDSYGIEYVETSLLDFHTPDIFYVTRVQKERFTDKKKYQSLKDTYCITEDDLKLIKKDAIIMHPLPRVGEISPEVDRDPRAVYFEQVGNGLYTRMALLLAVLYRGKK